MTAPATTDELGRRRHPAEEVGRRRHAVPDGAQVARRRRHRVCGGPGARRPPALNGVWSGPDGVAFRGIAMPENGLAPAVTGGYGFACVVNLGDRPWRHGPPAGFRAAHEFFRASTGFDEWLAVHLGGDGNAEARAAVRAGGGRRPPAPRGDADAPPFQRAAALQWDPAARDAFLEAARGAAAARPPVTSPAID